MVSLWGRSWTRGELLARVGRLDQLAGVQLVEASDGAERGVRLLRFRTGAGFEFDVLVDRGFDIGRAWLGGRPLSWWSPVGLISPWLHDSAGIEWFRGFPGGLVSTCGLDHTLLGGTDDSTVFNYPHRRTETYGLHGRYTGLPARLAGYGASWHQDECVLWAEGEVIQAALFGEQLVLHRRIEADLGGTALRITDTVTNTGATACPHSWSTPPVPGSASARRVTRLTASCSARALISSRNATSTTWRPARTGSSARRWSTATSAWASTSAISVPRSPATSPGGS
jgi:hypothetical protein